MIPKLEEYKQRWNVESEQSIKPGLDAMKAALNFLGNPQEEVPFVHLAGTNGKGSTLTFIEHISLQHGLTVGKFMSPCIVDVHDQIQINGIPISKEEMDFIFKQLKEAGLSGKLTDFELLTCVAFVYFAHQKVDFVLLEAGMGGREDSTNVISPIVSIITSIALEHTKFLGKTIESIAKHKAGIIKPFKPIIIGRLPEQAIKVVQEEALDQQSPLFSLGKEFDVASQIDEKDFYQNKQRNVEIGDLVRSLPGKHQADNMALAITTFIEIADYFNLNMELEKVRAGVFSASLPGRFEQVLPNVYFDGAHNPASAETLAQTIRQQFPNESIQFVIGMLADKDIKKVLETLESVSNHFYFVDFPNERAMLAKDMIAFSKATHKEILDNPISFIQQATEKSCKTFVTGSLYLLAKIRQDFIDRVN